MRANLELQRITKRKYPEIAVRDKVKVYKKKGQFDKERVPAWGDMVYEVKRIYESHGQRYYELDGYERDLLRHEILKV